PAPTAQYTLSLHDALPICQVDAAPERQEVLAVRAVPAQHAPGQRRLDGAGEERDDRRQEVGARGVLVDVVAPRLLRQAHLQQEEDRKSTRLNSSHVKISYA